MLKYRVQLQKFEFLHLRSDRLLVNNNLLSLITLVPSCTSGDDPIVYLSSICSPPERCLPTSTELSAESFSFATINPTGLRVLGRCKVFTVLKYLSSEVLRLRSLDAVVAVTSLDSLLVETTFSL